MEILLPRDVTNSILLDKKKKNSRVSKNDGSDFFLTLPYLSADFPDGNVVLKLGDSGFYNKATQKLQGAYGLRHIWDKHGVEIGATCAVDIVNFLEGILLSGAQVLLDNNKGPNKVIVVESGTGMMIVELKKPLNQAAYYSIVTAYDRKSHPGTILHTLL